MLEILGELGFKQNVAKTIFYLVKSSQPVTSREIETGMHLRQPEVSLALKELRDRGWINVTIKKKRGKGRPLLCLTPRTEQIKKDIIEDINKKIKTLEGMREEIERWWNKKE